MSDDILTRLRQAYKNADEVASVFLANEAADEIQQLVTQLRIQAEVVNGKNYHTISGGLHLDAADEIERLRVDRDNWMRVAKMMISQIDQDSHAAKEYWKAVRGER